MTILRTLTVASALFLGIAGAASAGSVTLYSSLDNTLVQVQPGSTQLSNGQGDIFVGRTNQDGQGPATISTRRGVIAFDVAGAIAAGSIITDVTLTMWDVRGLNGSVQIDLHRVLASWGEGSSFFNGGVGGPAADGDATWLSRFYNAADPASSPAWSTPGGDFDSTVSGSAIVTEHASDVEKAFSWLGSSNSQMIADVQKWLDDPTSNFGWLLQGDESKGQTAKRFRSGEADLAFRPTLTITYESAAVAVPEPGSLVMAVTGGAVLSAFAARRRRAGDAA
ncbi:MAG: DNRLRE domain-containing protein [Paludisphaera borealis]|uniref:DNRLRE domain-containing protein n=1 Tax=Paludisphaera borealis TaxID=1387353 RepID=UPI00284CA8CB|nr:DNRLRE domain-containing protein [Paludisphaera borealis]MDR3619165.1 DNRLRE domain-containing protein [Paludisphaera borealis]